jgi:hypothetical protein
VNTLIGGMSFVSCNLGFIYMCIAKYIFVKWIGKWMEVSSPKYLAGYFSPPNFIVGSRTEMSCNGRKGGERIKERSTPSTKYIKINHFHVLKGTII